MAPTPRMCGVLLAAPDRQRGTRQRDGKNGGEHYDSRHSNFLIVAIVVDPMAAPSIRLPGRGFNQRASTNATAAITAVGATPRTGEEERLGRVCGERDRQRGARLGLASWLGLGIGLELVGVGLDQREARRRRDRRKPARP